MCYKFKSESLLVEKNTFNFYHTTLGTGSPILAKSDGKAYPKKLFREQILIKVLT